MPPNAPVIIFDDSVASAETRRSLLESEGHDVIGTAGSIEALEKNLLNWAGNAPDEQLIVALIDNQAPWREGEGPDHNGVGGIAERMIKAAIVEVLTVATTSDGRDDVGYGDVRYNPKDGDGDLGKFVTLLPGKKR